MKRYYPIYCAAVMEESNDGPWVRYEDAQAEIEALKAELYNCSMAKTGVEELEAKYKERGERLKDLYASAGREERETAMQWFDPKTGEPL